MNQSSYTPGGRKRKTPMRNENREYPAIDQMMTGSKRTPDGATAYNMTSWSSTVQTESEPLTHHMRRNQYWELLHPPPSPPQEESPITILPSFSTLSKMVDGSARNRQYIASRKRQIQSLTLLIVDHQQPMGSKSASPRKAASLDSYQHHQNHPPTPPLSSTSRSLSTRSSSPTLSVPRSVLEALPHEPAPLPAHMHYFKGTR